MTKSLSKQEQPQMSRWFEGSPLGAFRDEMEQVFDKFFGGVGTRVEGALVASPRLDVSETDDAVEVDTDLPGFKPDEVHIEVHDRRLTVSGEHSEEQKEDDKERKYHRIERRSGSFSRSVWLPCAVDEDKVEAQLKDGVLHVRLPKTAETKTKKIKVQG